MDDSAPQHELQKFPTGRPHARHYVTSYLLALSVVDAVSDKTVANKVHNPPFKLMISFRCHYLLVTLIFHCTLFSSCMYISFLLPRQILIPPMHAGSPKNHVKGLILLCDSGETVEVKLKKTLFEILCAGLMHACMHFLSLNP